MSTVQPNSLFRILYKYLLMMTFEKCRKCSVRFEISNKAQCLIHTALTKMQCNETNFLSCFDSEMTAVVWTVSNVQSIVIWMCWSIMPASCATHKLRQLTAVNYISRLTIWVGIYAVYRVIQKSKASLIFYKEE